MARKKKTKKGFYRIIAKAIVEGSPFDVSKNGDGWKKVQELVVCYLLKDLGQADKYRLWDEYTKKIEGTFWVAVKYINDNPDKLPEFENLHVHLHRPEGKRNIEFLSIRKTYRKAIDRNTDRLVRRIETVARPAIKEISKTQPERLDEFQATTRKLLGSN